MAESSAESTTSIERPVGQCRQSPLGVRSFGWSSVKALASQMSATTRVMMWGCIAPTKIWKVKRGRSGKQDLEGVPRDFINHVPVPRDQSHCMNSCREASSGNRTAFFSHVIVTGTMEPSSTVDGPHSVAPRKSRHWHRNLIPRRV
jgi:hypothetical protein